MNQQQTDNAVNELLINYTKSGNSISGSNFDKLIKHLKELKEKIG